MADLGAAALALAGVLAGSGLTLLGSVLQAKSSERSLRIQLEHEEKRAAVDREWTLRREANEQRSELYSELLTTAAALVAILRPVVQLTKDPEKQRQQQDERYVQSVQLAADFQGLAARTIMRAVDFGVIKAAKDFQDRAAHVLRARRQTYLGTHADDVAAKQKVDDLFDELCDRLLPSLRVACRRDLGLLSDSTEAHEALTEKTRRVVLLPD